MLHLIRNAPISVSVGWHHVGWDKWHGTLVAIRALPAASRRRLADVAGQREPSPVGVLALAADGRRAKALQALGNAAQDAGAGRLAQLVSVGAAMDAPQEATALLNRLPRDFPGRHRLEALVAACSGDLTHAAGEARLAGWRANRLQHRLAGELAGLRVRPGSASRPSQPALPNHTEGVLHLVTNALPDVTAGYTVRTQGLVAAQRQIGIDAHVVTRLGFPVTAGHVAARSVEHVEGVPYHRLLPPRWLPAGDHRRLRLDIEQTARLVRQLRPAVLHAHSKYRNAQVALALRDRYGLPVVYEVRGFLEETWRSRGRDPGADAYRLVRECEAHCMSAADVIITLSNSMQAEILRRGIPADRVVIVPNAVGNAFLAEPPDATALRRQLGIDPDDVVVGSVTTVNDYEGLDVLIEAVAKLQGATGRARLLVVGAGPAFSALRRQAADRRLRDAVFTGAIPFADVRRFYATIDVFAVPRADVPVTRLVAPLKPLEAMATGKPVVASDLPPLREIVDDGATGVLVPPGDAGQLATELEALIADPHGRVRMGREARRWVQKHRTWSATALRCQEIYRQLMQ